MTDRSADWAARRRAWEADRLDPAVERAPERKRTVLDDQRHADRAALRPVVRRPRRTPSATSASPASRRSPAASIPTGYRSRLWTMRMFAGFGAAEDTNARFRQLLDAGQTGLSIAYDMPTLYGYDTDDPEAEGEFGTCGVAVWSLADMEVLLGGPAARPGLAPR